MSEMKQVSQQEARGRRHERRGGQLRSGGAAGGAGLRRRGDDDAPVERTRPAARKPPPTAAAPQTRWPMRGAWRACWTSLSTWWTCRTHFRQTIVQFFIDEHANGRTPNPCIECNRQIRFTYLLERALALDADYLATGHYAQVRHTPNGYQLLKGLDPNKDQSYVLHVLDQKKLGQVLFPIGGYTKPVVRELAQKFGLPVASKSESQDLCFLGDGDYRRFLQEYSQKASQPGPILTSKGTELGQHNGLPFYTIGQRKGLGISASVPLFVLRKDVAQNALIVGPKSELGQQTLIARDVNWLSGQPPTEPIAAQIKIRYKAKGVEGTVVGLGDGRSQVTFHEPVFGITAGQGAIFYDGDVCLGGGIIADGVNDLADTAVSPTTTAPSLQLADIQVRP